MKNNKKKEESKTKKRECHTSKK